MAEQFNKEDHETADGRPIEIVSSSCDSSDQAADLVGARRGPRRRSTSATDESDEPAGDPTIITPQSDDWLVDINNEARRDVIDLDATRASPRPGWASSPTGTWPSAWAGRTTRSATPRSSRCSKTAGRRTPDATPGSDWGDPPNSVSPTRTPRPAGATCSCRCSRCSRTRSLRASSRRRTSRTRRCWRDVRSFQGLVEHYMPATFLVNTKIAQGPRYGAFFLMPEDNLANLVYGERGRDRSGRHRADGRRPRGPRDDLPKGGRRPELQPRRRRRRALGERRRDGSGASAGSSTCSRTTNSGRSWTWGSGPPRART